LLNYLHCPLAPVISAKMVKCDCGKPVRDLSDNKGQPAEEKSPLKQRPEEVFAGNLFSAIGHCATDPIAERAFASDPALPAGFALTIFQPPRS